MIKLGSGHHGLKVKFCAFPNQQATFPKVRNRASYGQQCFILEIWLCHGIKEDLSIFEFPQISFHFPFLSANQLQLSFLRRQKCRTTFVGQNFVHPGSILFGHKLLSRNMAESGSDAKMSSGSRTGVDRAVKVSQPNAAGAIVQTKLMPKLPGQNSPNPCVFFESCGNNRFTLRHGCYLASAYLIVS